MRILVTLRKYYAKILKALSMIENQDFIFLKEKRALKEFDKIYDKWIEMNELYYKITEADFPGWYTESACTSILSGAVWSADTKSEFVALKEFQHDKKRQGQKKRKSGRADLYIGKKNKEYICEAKLRRFFVGDRKDFSKRLKTKLTPAAEDLKESWDKEHFHFGLAITFLNLWGRPCLLYTSPSPRDLSTSRMPSSA